MSVSNPARFSGMAGIPGRMEAISSLVSSVAQGVAKSTPAGIAAVKSTFDAVAFSSAGAANIAPKAGPWMPASAGAAGVRAIADAATFPAPKAYFEQATSLPQCRDMQAGLMKLGELSAFKQDQLWNGIGGQLVATLPTPIPSPAMGQVADLPGPLPKPALQALQGLTEIIQNFRSLSLGLSGNLNAAVR